MGDFALTLQGAGSVWFSAAKPLSFAIFKLCGSEIYILVNCIAWPVSYRRLGLIFHQHFGGNKICKLDLKSNIKHPRIFLLLC